MNTPMAIKPNTHIYKAGETAFVVMALNSLPRKVTVESCDKAFVCFHECKPIPLEFVFQTEAQALDVLEFNLQKALQLVTERKAQLA